MTAINQQIDESKAKLNELRDDAVRKAKSVQSDIVRTSQLLVGRVRDGGLEAALQAGETVLEAVADIGNRVPGAGGLAQTFESRAKELAGERAKLMAPPIEDYDELNVKEVGEALEGLDAWSLVKVREYEKAHKNRKTVFAAIDRRL